LTIPADPSPPTDDWCRRAEQVLHGPAPAWRDLLDLVREGIDLRRRWTGPTARRRRGTPSCGSSRRCRRCARSKLPSTSPGAPRRDVNSPNPCCAIWRRTKKYLGLLVGEAAVSVEAAATAAECLRDDLHWLGAVVAVAEGRPGPDALGRILMEQEALQHQMEAWDGHGAAGPEGCASRPRNL